MIDRSQYDMGLPAEDLADYGPGGYHQVHLSDTLDDGKYRILDKLGFGSFAIVWLARDEDRRAVAEQSHEHNHELEILQAIKQNGDPAHPGHKHVSHLLNSFYHEGPNGRHLCIVLEFLGPQISSVAETRPNYRLEGPLARRISSQLLFAVDYIRACGVAHGDIYMGNVLFRLSTLNETLTIDDPRVGKVSKKDGSPNEKGFPDYLVMPADYGYGKGELLDEVQLVDFGESFFVSNPPMSINTHMSFHPPEVVFRHPLSEATYELVTGRTPLEAFMNDHELIPQMQKVLGGVPEQWIQEGLETGVLTKISEESAAKDFLPFEERIQEAYANGYEEETLDLNAKDIATLGSYIRRMCVIELVKRATLAELMSHPWVVEAGERFRDDE
ncbi:kinase-like domain-containing protein [Trichoderma evansii]